MSFEISRRARGTMAEIRVGLYLLLRGYRKLCSNYYTPFGEIDIIAKKNGVLVFVEVRSKSEAYGDRYGTHLESVDGAKQKNITDSAKYYLGENPEKCKSYRFDVIGVTVRKNGSAVIEHVKNAFYTN